MILSDGTLQKMIKEGSLVCEPMTSESMQPASIDCHLGNDREMETISLDTEIKYRKFTADEITIPANSFLLATTREYIKIPDNITAFVEGRSSIGRMGLFIQNAGWVDPGFEGQITLELYNANSLPIRLKAGRRVCQLVFCKMDQKALTPYNGKYQGQRNTTGSRVFKDSEAK